MIKLLKYLNLIALALIIFSSETFAFVAQEIGQALSFKNVMRESVIEKTKKEEPEYVPVDDFVDYEAIVKKLIPDVETPPTFVNMIKDNGSVQASVGQTFFVVLPENQSATWNYDSNYRTSKIKNTEKKDSYLILEFETLDPGVERIFFDLVPLPTSVTKDIQSRILTIKVK